MDSRRQALQLGGARDYILRKDLRSRFVAHVPWLKSHRLAGDVAFVRRSGLFDEFHYRSRLPVGLKVRDPLLHYLLVGARWGVSPHPLFDGDWYASQSPELGSLTMSPLVHFLRFGARQGLNPNPLFDTAWYVQQDPHMAGDDLNPLAHFDRIGWRALRDPSPRFSTRTYLAAHPDVRALGINPLTHYLSCVKPWQDATEGIRLAPPADVGDFLFWGMFPWFFTRQRPQQLATALRDQGVRVFYFENTFVRAAEPGFTTEPLDEHGRLFAIRLHCRPHIDFYRHAPAGEALAQLTRSVACFLVWARLHRPISLVQFAFWYELARWIPNARLVYDCFDFHQGLSSEERPVLGTQSALCRDADLVVTSSVYLRDFAADAGARHVEIIRNAADFAHFSGEPAETFPDVRGRPTIGYFGAIAEWFDVELVGRVARAYPECRVILIGRDWVNARRALRRFANVAFLGELPYAELPAHLYAFDVAIIPFKVVPLTLATSPVKVYEYLSAARPVVSVNLPEVAQLGEMIRTADTPERFVQQIGEAMAEPKSDERARTRRQYAATQTWVARAQALLDALATTPLPSVSVVIIADKDARTTRACLANLEQDTDYEPYELITTGHGPVGDVLALLHLPTGSRLVRPLRPSHRARALPRADAGDRLQTQGDCIVLLDSQTRVMKGWLGTLVRHLHRRPDVGVICPLESQICREAGLEIEYRSPQEMVENVLAYTSSHAGEILERQAISFGCAAMPRQVLVRVAQAMPNGCDGHSLNRSILELGLKIACAKDVFVHRDSEGAAFAAAPIHAAPSGHCPHSDA